MKNKIVLLCIIALTFLLNIFFEINLLRVLFVYEVLFALIQYIFLLLIRKKVSVSLKVPYYHGQKDGEFILEIEGINKSIVPMPYIKFKIICENEFFKNKDAFSDIIMLDGKTNASMHITLQPKHCGKYKVHIEKVKVYDYFRLFGIRVKNISKADEFMILPKIKEFEIDNNRLIKNKYDWEEYSHTSGGEDTSEVFDIHEFRMGDTLQKVHWKLSAKTDDILVKEFSMPIEKMLIIFVDFYVDDIEHYSQDEYDEFTGVLSSVSWSLINQDINHIIIWYDDLDRQLKMAAVEKEMDVYQMLESICNVRMQTESVDVRYMYYKRESITEFSSSILIDSKGKVYSKNGKE